MLRIFLIIRIFIFGGVAARCKILVIAMQDAREKKKKWLGILLSRLLERYGNFISPLAQIDRSVLFPHPTAIVIGQGVVIGNGVRIYQGVTLGGRVIGDEQHGHYPNIGKNTVVFSGAVILGSVCVGENCVIGANAVVISDVPDNCVAVGVPARSITPSRTT